MSSTWTCSLCNVPNISHDVSCPACFNNMNHSESSPKITQSFHQTDETTTDNINMNNDNKSVSDDDENDTSSSDSSEPSHLQPFSGLLCNFTPLQTPFDFDTKSTIDPEIISSLQHKQYLLFHGFLRHSNIADIAEQFEEIYLYNQQMMYIPSDIISLCRAFFKLNIHPLCRDIHKTRSAIYTSAVHSFSGLRITNIMNEDDEDIITHDDIYELAMILRGERDCFIAYELMHCLIEEKPDLSEYHNAMGLILKRWNCLHEAETHYKLAINGEKSENIYKWNYGLLLEEEQKWDLALEQFLDASKNVDEKEPDYIFEAAYCYQKLGAYNNASRNYLKAIKMDGDKSSYWIYYAEYLCEELQQYDESIKCFEKAIALEKNKNVHYFYRFARYLRDFHQNYPLSEVYYRKCLAMKHEKKDTNAKCAEIKGVNGSYGYLLFLMKEYERANKYLSVAQITDPNNAWSFYYFGLLNVSYFNDIVKANEVLHKAISVCTTRHSIMKHLQRIKEVDRRNMWYHDKFEALLNQKFNC